MKNVRVVGLGYACLDILIRTEELPTWQGGTRLEALAIEGGGPVATALVAAQRLGVQTGFLGTYGSDRLGQIKLQTLVENDVDCSHAVQRPGPENQAVLVTVHARTGERLFSGFDSPNCPLLSVAELDRDYITSADVLHLDGMHIEAALQAARWMRTVGKPVMLDGSTTCGPVSESLQALVCEVDILICGSGFAPALTGFTDRWQAGQAVLDWGPRVVIQTEGADGSYTVSHTERFHTPAFPIQVVDTTGAGDVFHGAYLFGMLQGWDLRRIVRFCTAVSAIKCTRLGGRPGIPTYAETIRFLEEREDSSANAH
jgi:sulfofructose kinase